MAGYIGSKASVVSSGAERKKVFNITTTTTSLTGLVYTPTLVHVFHNGVRLVDGTDYTATNGTSITLTVAAENGDQVAVVSYATFQVADAYTKVEADGRYVNTTGDTLTGNLTGTTATFSGAVTGTDLTLSGGVYLGGTGAANHLDDYEEGVWSPTFQGTTSGSISFASEGHYTKIGRMVMASFYLTSKDFSAAAIVGTLEIAGLPFNVAILGQGLGNLAVNNFIAGASDYVPYAYSTDRLRVSKGNTSLVTDADLTQSASRAIAVSISYMSS